MMAKTGAARQRRMGKGSAMRRLRMLVEIERQAGFGPITCLFVVVFLLCSLAVWLADPVANTFGDGMWFSFQAVSTIGFGDVTAAGPVARIATVLLSVVSIFYIALITGVVVSYCNAMLRQRQEGTLAHFAENLERLDEMTPDELAVFCERVKEYRRGK